ncbi:MAG: methyltransferase [Pseudomonadota bacterium]
MDKVASPGFQSWASRFPLVRAVARKDGERLFDLVSGFVYSQVLFAAVELDLLAYLQRGTSSIEDVARHCGLTPTRAESLLQATSAVGLTEIAPKGGYRLARLGAASLGVPGLHDMIRHHNVFYRDLEDPVALLRGETSPELAQFWPYIRGETAQDLPAETAARYSSLMRQTQALVAEETLRHINLSRVRHLMDVGGGTGAFLKAVRANYPGIDLTLFDLPAVVAEADLGDNNICPLGGSFRDPLPQGADGISLVRVLYDHSDETVRDLIRRVYDALPPGGQLIISEPMSGGANPTRSGDVYFSLYTMAMTTGRARSPDQHIDLLTSQRFENIQFNATTRPFVTSCITASKPC